MTVLLRPSYGQCRKTRSLFMALALYALVNVGSVAAQTDVGFKGGLNLSSFYGENIGGSGTRNGHIFGAVLSQHIWGPFSVQPELYYSRKGATGPDFSTAEFGDVSNWLWNYNYVDAVALVRLRVTPSTMSPSLNFFGGLVVSFLAGAKATGTKSKSKVPPYEGAFPYVNPLNYNTKGSDVGGTVGADLAVPFGPIKITLDARFTRMLTTFDEAPYDTEFSRKHSALSFQVGVSLTPSAWVGGRARRRRPSLPSAMRAPPVNTLVMLERITREDIAARSESSSVYDLIRLERPQWVDTATGTLLGTLFLDGQLWTGAAEVIANRRGSEVEEVRRLVGGPGPYRAHARVIEIITRR